MLPLYLDYIIIHVRLLIHIILYIISINILYIGLVLVIFSVRQKNKNKSLGPTYMRVSGHWFQLPSSMQHLDQSRHHSEINDRYAIVLFLWPEVSNRFCFYRKTIITVGTGFSPRVLLLSTLYHLFLPSVLSSPNNAANVHLEIRSAFPSCYYKLQL